MERATQLVLRFNGSKTNQKGVWEQRTAPCRCPKPCVVHLSQQLCKNVRHLPETSLSWEFSAKKQKWQVLGRYYFNKVFIAMCKKFSLDKKYYTPYSLRIGGATEAYWQGKSVEEIMHRYGWKSRKSCMRYLRVTNIDLIKFK